MKKLVLIITALLMVTACSATNGEINGENTETEPKGPDEIRQESVDAIATAVSLYLDDKPDATEFEDLPVCNKEKLVIGSQFDLGFLVDDYLFALPVDPETGTQDDTGFSICVNNKDQIVIWSEDATKQINRAVK